LETTGFSARADRIIEIGAVKVVNGEIVDRFSTFVNPERPIPFKIEKLTSINDSMVIDAPKIEEVLPKFMEFCEGAVMVAHNAEFDMSFIRENCIRQDLPCDFTIVDTVAMSRYLVIGLNKYKLNNVAKALGIVLEHHHRAVDDAECTALIFQKLCKMLENKGITNLDELNAEGKQSSNLISKLPAHHAIILCKDLVGRVNLYKLISISHIDTFANKRPRILKSDYLKHKEGLMIGSACEAGELYQAILKGKPEQEVARLAEFYDYFEVQPIGNNAFMLRTGNPEIDDRKKYLVDSVEELQNVNKKIIDLGKKFNKMTVATCDVHFLDPEDEIYRRIIQCGQGYKDADDQPPLYLRTTDEMLKEFDYLDGDLAEEIVIKNPQKIADMIDDISPIHPDKCPPVLENSEENLRKICFDKAHDMYGENIPKIVEERLEIELDSIIGNGYAVMYIMAQRLVWKSNEDGYLVGSRGSVGSSFAATMSGITECNPLQPHYYCEHCKSSVFQDEYSMAKDGADMEMIKKMQEDIREVRAECGVGFDLPDGICPCCGEKMKKDGLEIPFETFLGFGGTKEPDIDLNFSGEYQANAHAYTEVMFGKGHTFRAGTITGVAEKTAFGYVKNYFEEHNINKRTAEIERIARGCEGIRRSTGQHPGGIVIVPRDKEIYDFTPIQKPANDMTTDIITTHFEYHAIDANLLKLDILGHDDPTMIRRLESLTGVHVAEEVPFDDKNVMSLFLSPEALGITSDDIDGCPTGSLGLPELGTDFVIQMLVDTKPTKFADLVRLAGLSHGTDVWLGNAQTLIQEGQCTISSAICTRDDIMVYLMGKGIDPQVSFQIMEHVRKGKGLQEYTDKQGNEINEEQVMIDHGVPDWYIWSCKKIKYMFPKAHAAAYVMMALRVAWFKVYKPLAYYAAYFGIRSKAFDYETMCQGRDKLEYFMGELKRKKADNTASPKDEASLGDMKIVQEMYARGFEFLPIDIYKAKAHEFQIIDGKLMPALDTIEGLGEKAADAFVEAVEAQGGLPFVSKNEMREKTKLTKTVIETMSDLHLLEGMPEDSQLSIFDF
jgi:DNA polymerase-3 subunit alpha (Gram-positive type)